MADEGTGTEGTEDGTEGTEGAEGAEASGVEFDGDFDAERAKRAIANGRAEEKKLKAKLAEQAEKLQGFEAAEAKKAEADKSNEQKLAEANATIESLKDDKAADKVRTDFVEKAAGRGYEDPALAFLAAKEQGLLGTYNRKTGDVADHDFEALEESHNQFATEAGRSGDQATGDAGARGGTSAASVGGAFNKAVRKSISGR